MSELKPILIVGEEGNDVAILQAALADLHVQNLVRVARNGEEAMRYLGGTEEYLDRVAHPAPGLMLLDLDLPGMSGFSLLLWLRRRPEFKPGLRVIVLTSLAWTEGGQVVKDLGADEVLERPIGYGQLKERVRGVLLRWQKGALPGGPCLGRTQ